MRTNYMMTVDDVMEELGVKRSKAYSILKQLNDELAKEGYGIQRSWKRMEESVKKDKDGFVEVPEQLEIPFE